MTTITGRIGKVAVALALIWCLLGGTAPAPTIASGFQWTGPYADNCYYYGDQTASYWAVCPLTTGQVNVYQAQWGQWVAVALVGYDSFGCLAAWIGGIEYVYTCPALVGQTLWGDYTITNWTPGTGVSTIGGEGLPAGSFPTLTGNALIDAINVASQYNDAALWLQPRCLYWSGSVCYVAS